MDYALNDFIFKNVPQAFCDAITSFCLRPSMEYDWVQYIPGHNTAHPRWQKELCEMLKQSNLFQTQKGSKRRLSSLCYLSPDHCDQNNNPLFEDLDDDLYLSTEYTKYLDILEPLGLRMVSIQQILERLRPYLAGLSPRIQDPCLDNDWAHACCAAVDIMFRRGTEQHFSNRREETPTYSFVEWVLGTSYGQVRWVTVE